MLILNGLTFPLKDPIPILTIVLFIILLAPILLRKLRIPSIIGLILAGMAIGDHGFNLVAKGSIDLFGKAGLLYIMFISGLELDMAEFKKNRYKSLVFGFFTFIIPLGLGFVLCHHLLHFDFMASLLVSSMFATHTLVAYPLASRMGITKNEAVTITVGGTIITDVAVLLILAVITGSVEGELNYLFWMKLGASFTLFAVGILWGFPVIGRWFFRKIKDDQTTHFIFVLAMVFLAAFLAEMAGVEGIIGAFLAGLALNQLIPHSSSLMNRVEFVGHAIFIPFFLISVGMLVDLKVLLKGTSAIFIASVLTIMALSTKWLAAFLSQQIFQYSAVQRRVIFGLSTSHAAATIAIILIGYNTKIIDENVLNGTIILILVTCMVGSFVTATAGKKLAVVEAKRLPDVMNVQERILIPVGELQNTDYLLDLAVIVNDAGNKAPVYMLNVMQDEERVKEKVRQSNKNMERAIKHGAESATKVLAINRVDLNKANGVARAVKEMLISDVLLEWEEKSSFGSGLLLDTLFGTETQNILNSVWETVFVCRLQHPVHTTKKTILVVSKNAELEIGFTHWVKRVITLSKQAGARMEVYCTAASRDALNKAIQKSRMTLELQYRSISTVEDLLVHNREVRPSDLIITVSARKGTISYQSDTEAIGYKLARQFPQNNLILLYPEQKQSESAEAGVPSDDIALAPIQEQLDNFARLGKRLKRILRIKF